MIYILLYCNSPFKLQHLIRDGRICFTGLIHNSTTDWCSAHSSSEPEQHSSRDTPYLPNGTYSLRSEQKECFATPNQGKLWLGAIMSPTLVKGHQNNQNFVYLNHKLNQESQILGRPNSDKCNVSLLEGKHNAGVIPLVHPTNSIQLVHPTAQTLSWQELSPGWAQTEHLDMSKTHQEYSGDAERSFLLLENTQNHLGSSPGCSTLLDEQVSKMWQLTVSTERQI